MKLLSSQTDRQTDSRTWEGGAGRTPAPWGPRHHRKQGGRRRGRPGLPRNPILRNASSPALQGPRRHLGTVPASPAPPQRGPFTFWVYRLTIKPKSEGLCVGRGDTFCAESGL
jgi:hypothetical protein